MEPLRFTCLFQMAFPIFLQICLILCTAHQLSRQRYIYRNSSFGHEHTVINGLHPSCRRKASSKGHMFEWYKGCGPDCWM